MRAVRGDTWPVTGSRLHQHAGAQIERLCLVGAGRAGAARRNPGGTPRGDRLRRLCLAAHRSGHHRRAALRCRGALPAAIADADQAEVPDDGQPMDRAAAATAPVGLLAPGTGGTPSRSLLWREMLRDFGITDIASVVFADRYGCWGFLDLWRRAEPFTDGRRGSAGRGRRDRLPRRLRQRQAAAFAGAPGTEPPAVGGPAVHHPGRRPPDHQPDDGGHRVAALAAADRAGASRRSRPPSTTSPPNCWPSRPGSTTTRRRGRHGGRPAPG